MYSMDNFAISKLSIVAKGLEKFRGPWKLGSDYYRLDGKTPKSLRHQMIKQFNDPTNKTRAFLISAKAGGQGINLTGANRVVLLDTSWNPSNDRTYHILLGGWPNY